MKSAKSSSIDISRVAQLAKLPLKKSEEEKFSKQFANVIDYFAQVEKVDTTSVESQGQVTLEENRFRDDEVTRDRMFTQSQALGQAKRTHDGFFVVDVVIDKS